MSLYETEKLIYQLNRNPSLRARFEDHMDQVLADYELAAEECRAIRDPDIGYLYVIGVNGQILMHYAAYRGYQWSAYIEAMREGERKYGSVKTGLYTRAAKR